MSGDQLNKVLFTITLCDLSPPKYIQRYLVHQRHGDNSLEELPAQDIAVARLQLTILAIPLDTPAMPSHKLNLLSTCTLLAILDFNLAWVNVKILKNIVAAVRFAVIIEAIVVPIRRTIQICRHARKSKLAETLTPGLFKQPQAFARLPCTAYDSRCKLLERQTGRQDAAHVRHSPWIASSIKE